MPAKSLLLKFLIISFIISFVIREGQAQQQVLISGPACVAAGVEYQYTISANWNAATSMTWCVDGGTITGVGSGSCKSGTPLPQIYVVFTAGTFRKINLTTSIGNATLNMTVSAALQPGVIDIISQSIYWGQMPADIDCTEPTGGSCSPFYTYQWQQSADNVTFTGIDAHAEYLSFSTFPRATTYYRRKVTVYSDGNSVTTGYSNSHTVSVSAPLNGGTISTANQTLEYPAVPAALNTSLASGGSCSTFSYQWEESPDNINFLPVSSGGTGQNYTFGSALLRSRYYRRKVVCTGPQTGYSNSVFVIVLFKTGILNASQSIAPGGAVTGLTVSAASGGFGSTYGYQWERSTDEINWTVVSGATTPSYAAPSPAVTTYYRVRITAASEFSYTNSISIRVIPTSVTVIPSSSAATASLTPVTMPAYPAGTDALNINYISTRIFNRPGIADFTTANAQTNKTDVAQSTTYLDGLGRDWQTVGKNATPAGKDIISTIWYDAYGRVTQNFLPYTDNLETGTFRTNPNTEQPAFYNSYFNNTESFYYYGSVYDNSPLNRPLMQVKPGLSWGGNNKGVRAMPRTNRLSEDVRLFIIAPSSGSLPQHIGQYSAGELQVVETTDEHENKVIEYKERNGLVILKKVQLLDILQDGHPGWLCTYYLYDDFNQLRYVLQPKAVQWLVNNNWTLSQPIADELCFNYEYDDRHRMIAKKVPGSGWVYMVYDKRDRIVFEQDANMRGKSPSQWMYTLYDEINRCVQTGMMSYTGTWDNLKTYVNGLSDASSVKTTTGTNINTTPSDMFITSRDYGRTSYEATNSITFNDGFTSEDNAVFTAQIIAEAATTFSTDISVNTYPVPLSGATLYPLTYSYYDDYAATTKTYNTANNGKLNDGGNPYTVAVPPQHNRQTQGITTVTKVRVIEDPNDLSKGKWLETVSFYDEKARPIQVQSTNYKGGIDITTNRYDFTGKVVSNYMVHANISGNVTNLRVLTSMKYDHAGRLETTTKTINNDAVNNKRAIATNTYDELGQLKNKKTGQKSASDPTALEDDNYRHNIQGWLKDINWYSTSGTYASQMNSAASKWFSMDLSYDWGFTSSQFNGNISGTRWESAGDGEERAFGFKYDAANRLLRGDFTQNNGGWNTSAGINFSMQMGDGITASSAYDENGNIKFMQQYGVQGVTSTLIDKMTYLYKQPGELSNKLFAVTEDNAIAATDYKIGDFTDKNRTGDDYDYDLNGNLRYDKNKKIALIEYNHLNLPWKLTVQNDNGTSKGNIIYIYDAAGNKLEKRTDESPSSANGNVQKVTQTSYLNGYVYENNKLQLFGHEEGRIRPVIATADNENQAFAFDYFLKDHLGNVRTVLTDEKLTNAYPVASLETATLNNEKLYYTIPDAARTDKTTIPAYPTDTYTNPNQWIQKLKGDATKVGTSIVIKVMAGDKVNIRANSWWTNNSVPASSANTTSPLTDIVNALITAVPGVSGSKITNGQLNSTILNPSVTDLLNDRNSRNYVSSKPKAYLNWILLDDQFNEVLTNDGRNSGFEQVGAENEFKTHTKSGIELTKNGYLYVYLSNESTDINAFFDNLQVTHIRGPLLEETHYYPFGLTMNGISSKAFGGVENKKKYNGYELNSDFDINLYESFYRSHDPQLGRFWQLDPKPTDFESPYAAMGNNPIKNFDL